MHSATRTSLASLSLDDSQVLSPLIMSSLVHFARHSSYRRYQVVSKRSSMGRLNMLRTKIQHSPMFIRTRERSELEPGVRAVLMSSCGFASGKWNGIQVALISLKQGTYESQPASFFLIEISEHMTESIRQTRFDFEISREETPASADPSAKPYTLAAYGPAHIVSPPRAKVKVPASIVMTETPTGLQLTVTRRQPGNERVPHRLTVAIVIVHSSTIRLKVFPTYDTFHRLLAFARAIVVPFFVDLAVDFRPIATCDRAQQDCHTSCNDFGPDHMSPAFWYKRFAHYDIERLAAGSTPCWVRYSSTITMPTPPQHQESARADQANGAR